MIIHVETPINQINNLVEREEQLKKLIMVCQAMLVTEKKNTSNCFCCKNNKIISLERKISKYKKELANVKKSISDYCTK